MALNITVTNAGRAELINADHTGTGPVTITHVAFSGSVFTPSKTLTSLPEEIKRVSSIAGEVVADDTISVTAKDEGPDAYSVHSIGLISEYGTLFAVYSQPAPIIEKSGPTTLLLTIDIILADLPSASLTIGDISFSNPPASITTPGVVTLNNATDSSAQHQAATPRAVKAANDNAETRLAKSQNLSDLPSPSQARSNLGLGASATMGTTASRTSSSTATVLQAKAMNDHRQSGDHDDRYVQRSGDSMSGDLTLSKSNPWLTLNSTTSGGIGSDQGAGVSIGESGYKGGAAMHLTYTGDGKGHIGMGTVDPDTGIPEYNAMELHYRGYDVTFKGALQLPGATTLEGVTTGLRIGNAGNGSVDIGNRNTGYTHYQSTTGKHYFYGDVHAQGRFAGDGSGLTGTASLRARGTTKDDVGLSRIPNVEVTANPDPSTIMQRNTSGDVWARLFRSTYIPKNSNVQVIYTSASDDGTDFMRPSTPGQVMDAIGATRRINTGSGLAGGGNLSGDLNLSVDNSVLRTNADRASDLRLNKYTYLNDYDEPFGSDHGLRFYVRDGVIVMLKTGGETRHPELDLDGDRVYHQGNLDSAFASNLGPSGSARLPGGLIIQWGQTGLMGIDSNAAVNFNVTFPNRCLQVVASTLNSFTGDDDVFARVIEHTRSQVTLRTEAVNEDYSGSRRIMFIAIGH
ncbi:MULTISPECIES: tail fiber protein [unclassified Halomonas]|uniref:gp53-like domain-containing protein n=1 Tax=unclassified Halomonas TaxID=2609666 RepID=UPI001EF7006E|nr:MULTISPECIES: tail fiber protein [unclassified Halomonas]MCG7576812.1 tail fiber protein [Halomonas sp. MMH1-48]MCG7603875.1 tail fiber protein [Halomonas sp. MM17-34]MCG7613125.1 tail fiber protein [Halomonas sp. MM17-29]MCG7619587.1 tail fiber protein [Halomonas sp. DSH1-27]